ncbi:chromatin assembly factor 1 subunit A-domain-containing protein [Plectosphaerella plurivora]|uniref:Chromatin assembly factor 1 subunit A-domain-containing protein n=1 Tax=Plectosphaerella plurivora TaxID=936078 RepID=A0A9P9AEC6_9PEZI|nr:chromatin assembly factor 1 subunit A-domain-containing protein [Plectosphaerella plurivora]
MSLISAFMKPLSEMDPNSRKRKADGHADDGHKVVTKIEPVDGPKPDIKTEPLDDSAIDDADDSDHPTPSKRARTSSSSSLSSVDSISDVESDIDSPIPNGDAKTSDTTTPTKMPRGSATPTSTKPKTKRTRLTPAEKLAREAAKESKRQEREQRKKENEDKKAVEAVEKSQKKKEREEKKALADAEKQARDQERGAKRAKKEEEERKAKLEKEKKERSQLKLNSFFRVPASTPKKAQPPADTKASASPSTLPDRPAKKDAAPQLGAYDKLFKPFFVKAGMRLATSPFQMDEETMAAKSNILDEYLSGRRGDLEAKKFDPVETFALVGHMQHRGILHEPVKTTVERLRLETHKAESRGDIQAQQQAQREARKRLARIPMKSIRFQQDVRPPYLGTTTLVPHQVGLRTMRKVARKSTTPVLPLNYDYDSEAEWQEEEGEDLDGDDEDEEDLDDGDEVNELIDDSEAVDVMRFGATGLEPVSTGICWEDHKRKVPCVTAQQHRMEFIFTDALRQCQSIDPFSSSYWEPEPAVKPKSTATNAFEQISASGAAAAAAEADKAKSRKPTVHSGLPSGLSDEDLTKMKKAIMSTYTATPAISKLGMLELLKSSGLKGVKVNGKDISRNDVKTVIDVVALRKKKANEVTWSLKPEHAL